ncbi:MAG: tRNA dihydrouridine(20/20a) synthase DusA [bacterium]
MLLSNSPPEQRAPLLSVAPMMAWTDRHCRYLHRLFAPNALLFTEMVTTGALLHGQQWQLLDFNPAEHPLALQLGGSEPGALAQCAQQAAALGYDEVNLNVGCPSERVQKGAFGACLMREPELVAECVAAMCNATHIPITVKCRLGVDNDDSDELLLNFIDSVSQGGCQRFYVHARKAILAGLSPAQNRSIPPLQAHRVELLKHLRPDLQIIINGGIDTTAEVQAHLRWADGVMIGRAAYHNPVWLSTLDQQLFGDHPDSSTSPQVLDVLSVYRAYIKTQLALGEPLHAMTRHLLSVCNGQPGARRFRQLLSDNKRLKHNDINLLDEALAQVFERAA